MQVAFHRLAADDYTKARRWYAKESLEVANRFRLAVLATVKRIEASPEAFAVQTADFRAAPVRRFPYRLWYSERGPGFIMIVAVAHTRRRPGYWRRRKI